MLKLNKIEDIAVGARQFLELVTDSRIFAFKGEMGAGKTTFIKAICKELGVEEDVTSPTFAIVNEYQTPKLEVPIYHFDFYRINNQEEAFDMGYEEYFYSGAYCFIEWPEKIQDLLPLDITYVEIRIAEDDSRLITIEK